MKITTEKLERSQVLLNIEVEPDVMERSLERAYRRIANRTVIPGFRKGKAPRSLIERYVGRGALVEEALELLIPEAYNEALATEQIDAIAQPTIEVVQTEPPVFKATVPIRPTVELGDYRSLGFSLPAVEVTDQQVDEALDQLRQRYAPWEPVERPVEFGDLVTLDVDSSVEDGKPFLNDQDISYPVTETFQYPVPGFPAELVGMNTSEPKEFTLTLPEDYPQPDLAGKAVTFKATVREVKAKKVAELNDEFAKDVGEGHESLEALRTWLRQQIQEDQERDARRDIEEQVVQAVVDQATVEYPEVLIEHEIEHLLEDIIPANLGNNQARLEAYLQSIGKTRDELKEERRPDATSRVLRSLILAKAAEQEEITVNDEDISNEIARIVVTSGSQAEQVQQLFTSPAGQESIGRMLRTRKTIERLVERATGVAASPVAVEETAAETAPAVLVEEEAAAEVAPATQVNEEASAEVAASGAEEQPSGPATT